MITGGLSFLGSILSGSKIYSAITAFVVAPVTILHPLLAAGWFSGIVEAKLRHISMDDAVKITKVDSFRELLGNNLFRVLLVVVGTNIGATIGLFLIHTKCYLSIFQQDLWILRIKYTYKLDNCYKFFTSPFKWNIKTYLLYLNDNTVSLKIKYS